MNKRHWLLLTLGVVAALLLALSACAQPTPETIIETVIETVVVEKEVEGETVTVVETVIVEKEVEKIVTVEVEAAMEEAPENWAHLPMEETTTVVLSVESGAQEKTLGSFHDEIMEKLNIDLQVVAHPFSEQFEIQYLDLASRSGQFDVLSFWPVYTGDFAPFLEPLGGISPGGADQVWVDLQMDDVQPAYLWSYQYKGDLYATQYDGDVKLLHYRHDLANDPDEIAAFEAEYGYAFDIDNLTWDQFLDVARFFQRPDEDFYGAGEIAGFLAGWFFRDRFVGSGGITSPTTKWTRSQTWMCVSQLCKMALTPLTRLRRLKLTPSSSRMPATRSSSTTALCLSPSGRTFGSGPVTPTYPRLSATSRWPRCPALKGTARSSIEMR
jgi:ABC-type glycerol-3-phosphate transport system substrate-binding protein